LRETLKSLRRRFATSPALTILICLGP